MKANLSWPLDADGIDHAEVFFSYEKRNGENEVQEIVYQSPYTMELDELREAVIDRIGPCVFADDLTVRKV